MVRCRPRTAAEKSAEADFTEAVELEPEARRLKLKKNNWDGETYVFDDVLSDTSSQKKVYEIVAKPVVEVRSQTGYLDEPAATRTPCAVLHSKSLGCAASLQRVVLKQSAYKRNGRPLAPSFLCRGW